MSSTVDWRHLTGFVRSEDVQRQTAVTDHMADKADTVICIQCTEKTKCSNCLHGKWAVTVICI